MKYIIVQCLGIIAFFVGILSYQFNKKKYILSIQILYNTLYGVQYLMLGSLNSMFMCIIASIRNGVYCFDENYDDKTRKYILFGFVTSIVITTTIHSNGILSMLGGACTILTSFALWQKKEKHIRVLSLFATIIWLAHDILIGSYAAMVDTFLLAVSIMSAIYRFDIKRVMHTTKQE